MSLPLHHSTKERLDRSLERRLLAKHLRWSIQQTDRPWWHSPRWRGPWRQWRRFLSRTRNARVLNWLFPLLLLASTLFVLALLGSVFFALGSFFFLPPAKGGFADSTQRALAVLNRLGSFQAILLPLLPLASFNFIESKTKEIGFRRRDLMNFTLVDVTLRSVLAASFIIGAVALWGAATFLGIGAAGFSRRHRSDMVWDGAAALVSSPLYSVAPLWPA